jgi:hypothetical protein
MKPYDTPDYLSEEELLKLISDIENEDIVKAPPDIMENILSQVQAEGTDRPPASEQKEISLIERRRYFIKYCLRTALSAAAAIALTFSLPYLKGTDGLFRFSFISVTEDPDSMSRDEITAGMNVPDKSEVLSDRPGRNSLLGLVRSIDIKGYIDQISIGGNF